MYQKMDPAKDEVSETCDTWLNHYKFYEALLGLKTKELA